MGLTVGVYRQGYSKEGALTQAIRSSTWQVCPGPLERKSRESGESSLYRRSGGSLVGFPGQGEIGEIRNQDQKFFEVTRK